MTFSLSASIWLRLLTLNNNLLACNLWALNKWLNDQIGRLRNSDLVEARP